MFTSAKRALSVTVTTGCVFGFFVLPVAAGSFEAKEFVYSGGPYHDEVFHYRLYVPSQLVKGKKYPLILWMHGVGKAGRDNRVQVAHLCSALFAWEEENGEFPGFILSPQAPEQFASWHAEGTADESGDLNDLFDLARLILQAAVENYPIDEDRITLTGVSAGGTACWEMAGRYPDLFAAVVPMASGGTDSHQAERLARVPIWVFHNEGDTGAPIDKVRKVVGAIENAGGTIHLTALPYDAHDCWTVAFDEYKLLDWLLQQRKGGQSSPPPGYRRWEWWQYVVLFGLPTLIVTAWIFDRRRRKLVRARTVQSEL